MTDDGRKSSRDKYPIGYKKPPKEHQFRKDHQPVRRGRTKKPKSGGTDVAALLSEPLPARIGGVVRQITAFEIGLRQMVRAALKGNLKAALEFIKRCEEYGIIEPARVPESGGVLVVPKTWIWDDWMAMFEAHGSPPWPGPRSGMPDDPPADDGEKVHNHATGRKQP
jgi:hypothetical protein